MELRNRLLIQDLIGAILAMGKELSQEPRSYNALTVKELDI